MDGNATPDRARRTRSMSETDRPTSLPVCDGQGSATSCIATSSIAAAGSWSHRSSCDEQDKPTRPSTPWTSWTTNSPLADEPSPPQADKTPNPVGARKPCRGWSGSSSVFVDEVLRAPATHRKPCQQREEPVKDATHEVPGWSAKPLVSAHDRIMGTHKLVSMLVGDPIRSEIHLSVRAPRSSADRLQETHSLLGPGAFISCHDAAEGTASRMRSPRTCSLTC